MKAIRIGAGALILVLLVGFGLMLIPHYVRNYRFEQRLERIAAAPENETLPDEFVRTRVTDSASGLGIPLRNDQVKVIRTANHLKIEVRYIVPVDLSAYSVDLHFNPTAAR